MDLEIISPHYHPWLIKHIQSDFRLILHSRSLYGSYHSFVTKEFCRYRSPNFLFEHQTNEKTKTNNVSKSDYAENTYKVREAKQEIINEREFLEKEKFWNKSEMAEIRTFLEKTNPERALQI